MTIPVCFPVGGRGTWDQAMIEAAVAGTLWPLPVGFEVVESPQSGGVLVVHGELAAKSDLFPVPPRTVLIHASDEHQSWDSARYRSDFVRTWVQHVNPLRTIPADRRIVPGWPPGTREGLATLPRAHCQGRRRLAGFAGQAQNDSRRACIQAMRGIENVAVHVSNGFAQGMSRPDYLRFLSETAVIPSPAGNVNPEGFRLYEALEAGCLPVAQRTFPGFPDGFDWWGFELGEQPGFPILDAWWQLAGLLDTYRTDALRLQGDANRAGAWWLRHKRAFAQNLAADCFALGTPGDWGPVTAMISSSPVPSHPETTMIEDTIRRIRAYPELAKAEIIIMLDGVPAELSHTTEAYEEYKRRLIDLCNWHPDFFGCLPLVFSQHTHQATMTRHALSLVRTPLIFYVEHDTHPKGEIDFAGMIRVLTETDFANAIRLHINHEVLDEHRYLYTDMVVNDVSGVPLIRTNDWSQRPHLARTQWYRETLDRYVAPGQAIWIEHAWYGPVRAAPWEDFRICLYAPPENMLRSGHVDGRRLGAE